MINILFVSSHTGHIFSKECQKSVSYYEVLLLLKLRADIYTFCLRMEHHQSVWWVPLHLRTNVKLIAQIIGVKL